MTRRPTTAARTEPKEKKTERAVTRYCFDLGMCSNRSVPSVGIEPYKRVRIGKGGEIRGQRTPTALPSRNSRMLKVKNELANEARTPKMAVKKRVALKAVLRPSKSEPLKRSRLCSSIEWMRTHKFPSRRLQTSFLQTWPTKRFLCIYLVLYADMKFSPVRRAKDGTDRRSGVVCGAG